MNWRLKHFMIICDNPCDAESHGVSGLIRVVHDAG
jgi:hypothetical protein